MAYREIKYKCPDCGKEIIIFCDYKYKKKIKCNCNKLKAKEKKFENITQIRGKSIKKRRNKNRD